MIFLWMLAEWWVVALIFFLWVFWSYEGPVEIRVACCWVHPIHLPPVEASRDRGYLFFQLFLFVFVEASAVGPRGGKGPRGGRRARVGLGAPEPLGAF